MYYAQFKNMYVQMTLKDLTDCVYLFANIYIFTHIYVIKIKQNKFIN